MVAFTAKGKIRLTSHEIGSDEKEVYVKRPVYLYDQSFMLIGWWVGPISDNLWKYKLAIA